MSDAAIVVTDVTDVVTDVTADGALDVVDALPLAPTAARPRAPQPSSNNTHAMYSECTTTIQLKIPFVSVGRMLHTTLTNIIVELVSGKCITEGFVKPGTVKVSTYSGGRLSGSNVVFDVVYTCRVCFPVAGMNLNCRALEVTKGGIRAESADASAAAPSPFVLFVARDLEYKSRAFAAVSVDDTFVARVIGQRFELNDAFVSIIGEVVPPSAAPHR